MWGIHKAHLAGMYGDSGWQENRLEITTAKTLDDLLEAEQMLYDSAIRAVEGHTRQVVSDYVYFTKAFDFDVTRSALETLVKAGVSIIPGNIGEFAQCLSNYHSAIGPTYKAYTAIEAYSKCMSDDTKYTESLTKHRETFNVPGTLLYLTDIEELNQIERSHDDFVYIINKLKDDTTIVNEKELEIIIQEQINYINLNQMAFPVTSQRLNEYHKGLDKAVAGTSTGLTWYSYTTIAIGSVGCIVAVGTTGPIGIGLCGATVTIFGGTLGWFIELDSYESMLNYMLYEFYDYGRIELKGITNTYEGVLATTMNNLDGKLEHLPNAKLLDIDASNINVGETTQLVLKISNIGTKDVEAKGYFEIYKDGDYFATLETSPITITEGLTRDLSTSFSPPLDGKYAIYGYVIYENIRTEKLSTQISVAPVTSAIVVNTNNANAKFTIIGLQSFSGDGSSWSTTEALIGTYKIIFDPIEGYDTPPSQELVLTPDSTITFTGDYIQQTVTYSVTLNSNSADIPLIVDGKVIYHDELPKTFTWSKNSEHTIKAQTEVYKEASTKYVFVKWDDGNTDSERTITINSDKTYNAEYKTQYYLSLKTNPENIGTVFGAGWYDVNSPAEITAPVITGYAFTGWTVDRSTVVGNSIMISMDSPHNAVANYVSTDTTLPTVIGNTPTATIDSITPNTATQDEDTVCFKGHGTDTDGYIVDYYWESSKDGFLSSSKEFTKSTSKLAVGTHTIYFKVKDDDGQWSDWTTAMLTRTVEGTSEITAYSFQYPIDDYAVTGYKFGQEVGSGRFYLGEDMLKPPGTPVYACADGVVKLANNKHAGDENYGGLIIVEHTLPAGEKVCALYGHLDHSKTLVVETEIVKKGETIGEIGRKDPNINGNSTPHLHFGIRYGAFSGEYASDPNTTLGWYWAGYGKIDPNLKTNWWLKPSKFIGDHLNAQSSIAWYEQEGMQIAKSQNKPTMILFSSDRCPACAKLTGEFADTRVINMSKKFVPIVGSRELDSQYGIRYVPTIVFTNSQGMEVHRIVGYRDADTLVNEMQYALMLSSKPLSEPFTSTNTLGMEFVLIPAGKFEMGSPSGEEGRDSDEGPVHHVNIKKAFYMGGYEVTQKQWHEIMGDNPSYFEGDNLPVEQVFWDDVQEFIKKLNEKEGTDKYRLPSEAEWEYACRAGTTTRYSFGDDESKLGDYAWYDDNSGGKTHPVGQKKANPWGLYDMHGNVGEWVQDCWHDSYSGAPTDGRAWVVACEYGAKVYRGGSWGSDARGCRSARRVCCGPRICGSILSFRLLKEV
jgi:uncharacterized repeat protein (TIGR02543 family)